MPKISVVLPIYLCSPELTQYTRDCIHSLDHQFDELIIIDDASLLPTGEFRKYADRFIINTKNRGYVRSANIGFKECHGEYICLVCNDTRLLEGSLQDLCGEGFMFPKVYDKTEPFWDGAFYSFPRDLLVDGLYDETFKIYFGDLDKFYRAKKKGIQLKKVDSVKVFHHRSATTARAGLRESSYNNDFETFKKKWGFDPIKDDRYYYLI